MLEKAQPDAQRGRAVTCAVIQSTVPAWLNIVFVIWLIFGGCCANVFALEAIISEQPDAGALITLTQFLVCSLFTLPNFFSLAAGPGNLFLKPRGIPLRSWIIFTAYFLTVNLLNNCAFSFRISVPLHIIVRSAGPVASMVVGYLYNSKRYSRVQIASVLLLTVGVVGAALADAHAKGKFSGGAASSAAPMSVRSAVGFCILGLAMVLAAFQGVYADKMYARYGHQHWREALFYCHTLSLPFFLPVLPQLIPQLRAVLASPALLDYFPASATSKIIPVVASTMSASAATAHHSHPGGSHADNPALVALGHSAIFPYLAPILAVTPVKLFYLVLNALTQYCCIRGVHILAAKTSSLTVVIVLNVRKLVSLMLSVYIFGNMLAPGVVGGAFTVFLAGGIYAYASSRSKTSRAVSVVGPTPSVRQASVASVDSDASASVSASIASEDSHGEDEKEVTRVRVQESKRGRASL
ncbi:golgi uridine diphosphate-N- acetylglucosamine transporter [Ascosphaera acerosa]|nr:golgi uridine diphosphate-N- acetylglucosamine transporter [Ascosphaera acerosa]